jgi:hypothetical protein
MVERKLTYLGPHCCLRKLRDGIFRIFNPIAYNYQPMYCN